MIEEESTKLVETSGFMTKKARCNSRSKRVSSRNISNSEQIRGIYAPTRKTIIVSVAVIQQQTSVSSNCLELDYHACQLTNQ